MARRVVTLLVAGAVVGALLAALLAGTALLVGSAAMAALGGEAEGQQLHLEISTERWTHVFWRLLVPLQLFGWVTVSSWASAGRRRAAEDQVRSLSR